MANAIIGLDPKRHSPFSLSAVRRKFQFIFKLNDEGRYIMSEEVGLSFDKIGEIIKILVE